MKKEAEKEKIDHMYKYIHLTNKEKICKALRVFLFIFTFSEKESLLP